MKTLDLDNCRLWGRRCGIRNPNARRHSRKGHPPGRCALANCSTPPAEFSMHDPGAQGLVHEGGAGDPVGEATASHLRGRPFLSILALHAGTVQAAWSSRQIEHLWVKPLGHTRPLHLATLNLKQGLDDTTCARAAGGAAGCAGALVPAAI